MSLGEIVFIGWSLLMVIITTVFIVWGWETGQFKNIEKAKYDMLQEREPLPWPGRESKSIDKAQVKDDPEADGGNL